MCFPENVDLQQTINCHIPLVLHLTLQETHVGVSHLWALGRHEQTAHDKHQLED